MKQFTLKCNLIHFDLKNAIEMAKKQLLMMKNKKNVTKKFIWDEILNLQSKKEHDKLVKEVLPRELGIRYETLNNYRNIPSGSSKDIPTTINLRLCNYFKVEPKDSVLDELNPICFDSKLCESEEMLANKFGMKS